MLRFVFMTNSIRYWLIGTLAKCDKVGTCSALLQNLQMGNFCTYFDGNGKPFSINGWYWGKKSITV